MSPCSVTFVSLDLKEMLHKTDTSPGLCFEKSMFSWDSTGHFPGKEADRSWPSV